MRRISSSASCDVFLKMTTTALPRLSQSRKLHCLMILLVLLILFPSKRVHAAEVKLTPRMTVSGSYDDNIFMSPQNQVSSSIATVSPGLTLDYETLLSKVFLSADLDIMRYLDESELNRTNQYYRLNGEHRFTERLDTSAAFKYYRDTTLNSYLQETGRVINRVQRDFLQGDGKASYDITELSGISAHYRYQNVKYDSTRYSDYDGHEADVYFYHHLKNQLDTFSVGPSYYYRTSDQSDLDAVSLDFAWARDWSEITKSNVAVGARYTTVKKSDGTSNNNWGAKASVSLTSKGLASRTSFRYFHDIRTTVDGDEINVDNLYLTYRRSITERFGAGINGRLVFSYKLFNQQANIDDERYYWIEPLLFYRLTEKLDLSLRYRYQYDIIYKNKGDQVARGNKVWLQLSYALPLLM